MTLEQARSSWGWNSLTQALGTEAAISPVVSEIGLREAAAVLLCSDGLSEMVSDARIEELLAGHRGDPDASAAALIQAALDGGGHDNVTVVVLARAV